MPDSFGSESLISAARGTGGRGSLAGVGIYSAQAVDDRTADARSLSSISLHVAGQSNPMTSAMASAIDTPIIVLNRVVTSQL